MARHVQRAGGVLARLRIRGPAVLFIFSCRGRDRMRAVYWNVQ